MIRFPSVNANIVEKTMGFLGAKQISQPSRSRI